MTSEQMEFALRCITEPVLFLKTLWPNRYLYDQQLDIINSIPWNIETWVPAGNKLGKDYTGGFVMPWFFTTRHPCRIVNTSAKDEHLIVLWGEMNNWIKTARKDTPFGPLRIQDGGPFLIKHREIRKVLNGDLCDLSYIKGMVANQDSIDSLGGHHIAQLGDNIPRTMFVADECSSVSDDYVERAGPWADRMFFIGNTWPCDNFWKRGIKGDPRTGDPGGDKINPADINLPPSQRRYWRKIIHIKATDSPNVKRGLEQEARGEIPDDKIVVPGVKSYSQYKKDLVELTPELKSVRLDAEFYEGVEVKLYPQMWLDLATTLWRNFRDAGIKRKIKAMGVDPGEGSADTAFAGVDEFGLVKLEAYPTPDTKQIYRDILKYMAEWGVSPSAVVLDSGGGGRQIADDLRSAGYPVTTVGFGEAVTLEPKRGLRLLKEKVAHKDSHYAYTNRRAQMYGELSEMMDANGLPRDELSPAIAGYSLPPGTEGPQYAELLRQLTLIPRMRDGEGRLMMLPKAKKAGGRREEVTLEDLIGRSPDHLDALVLAVHRLLHKAIRQTAGAVS
jgi:hypothetical protein